MVNGSRGGLRVLRARRPSHYENFPVASMLLPAPMRPHIAARVRLCARGGRLCRRGRAGRGERQRLLDGWRARLQRRRWRSGGRAAAASGRAVERRRDLPRARRHDPRKRLPVALFDDLLSAFGQDVDRDPLRGVGRRARLLPPLGQSRWAGWCCASPATTTPRLDAWSDAICTALQLTNFWQDLKVDFDRGRIYLPAEEIAGSTAPTRPTSRRAGSRTPGARPGGGGRRARARCSWPGGPLCDAVAGRLKHELRATWLGGMRMLARIERADFDVVARRPSLGATDLPWLAWKLALAASRRAQIASADRMA